MKRRLNLRFAVGLTVALAVAAFGIASAMAEVSPETVTLSTTQLYWSGQGTTNNVLDNSLCGGSADPGSGGFQNGATASNYLVWVFSTDGGSISDIPTLTVNGTTYGNAHVSANGTWQIVTPYIDPSTITPADKNDQSSTGDAWTNFHVETTGGGAWKLVISHGCGGGTIPPAADLTASKTASPSFTRTYTWGVSKEADKTQVLTAGGGESGPVNYTVSVTHDGGTDSGWTVTGDITVNNPNAIGDDVTGVSVTDAINDPNAICTLGPGSPGVVDPSNATIPGAGSVDFPYSCTYLQAPAASGQTNTASITWPAQTLADNSQLAGNAGNPLHATANVDWTSVDPDIVDGSVTVTDPAGGGTLGTVSYTDPSPTTFNYSNTFADPAGTCTGHDNTATITTSDTQKSTDSNKVTVTDCQGADLTVSKDATPSFTRKYTWHIDKSADPTKVFTAGGADGHSTYTVHVTHDNGTDGGWTVTGTITVTNPNDWEAVTLTGVSDAIDNGGNCSITSGDVNGTIAAGDSATFGYKCTYSSAPNPAAFTNTATATWDASAASTPDGSADGTATGAFGDPTTIVDGIVAVTDTVGGSLGTVSYTDPNPTTFRYDGTVSGPAGTCTQNHNTATFTTNTTGTTDSASATVLDCQGADLTVTKTATGSFNRDYDWSVVKKQTTSSTPINSSASSVTVAYKVTASWTGPVDSGWKVTGSITVHNPNDWESITLTGVTDAINNGGTCVVSGNTGQTIAANSDSTGLTYTCTYASAPSPAAGTNTATATWDKTAASTPHGSASGTKGVDFSTVTPTITHNTTTVMDAFNGGAALTLGLANINGTFVKAAGNNLANWTSSYLANTFTFTYTRSVPVVASMCKKYDNTATVSGDATNGDNSSSASVTVCGLVTGGLTIGYWGNNNGKAQECANDPKWRQLLDGTWTTAPYTGGSYLRNANGTYYTVPPTPATCASATSSFDSWLQGANSVNASYMLSAQLAAAILNVNLNGMNGNACIVGTSGPITINNLIANVITFLRANGNTTAAGAARTLAVNYQTILNSLNNGQVYATTGC